MKIVVLLDCKKNEFYQIIELMRRPLIELDTTALSEDEEIGCVLENIMAFHISNKPLMLIRFSGKNAVARELGDEYPGMLVCLSNNRKSLYYVEDIKNSLLETIHRISPF
jgi:hypothetical protein